MNKTATYNSRREALQAYQRALRREAHVLIDHPELAFQQLHNRLQWEGEAVEESLADERERRKPRRAGHPHRPRPRGAGLRVQS